MKQAQRIALMAALAIALGAPATMPAFAESDTSRNEIESAAEAVRGELGPALMKYDQAKKTLEALEVTDIATARVQGLQDATYDGTEKRPTVTLRIDSIKNGKKTETSLREGVDFTVQFDGDLVNPGTVSVSIVGIGDYTGTVETSFTIVPADLSHATINVITDQKRTGSAIEPEPVVKLDGRQLVRGVDYEVSYSNNIDEGTAALVIEGIGNCTGETHATFQITENPREGKIGYRAVFPYVAAAAAVCAVALAVFAAAILHKRRKAKRER